MLSKLGDTYIVKRSHTGNSRHVEGVNRRTLRKSKVHCKARSVDGETKQPLKKH